ARGLARGLSDVRAGAGRRVSFVCAFEDVLVEVFGADGAALEHELAKNTAVDGLVAYAALDAACC
ncbi:unnamed protein product, partial [Tilletia laevis]